MEREEILNDLFFSIDDLLIFTYDNEITDMILNHNLNKPEEGHLFVSCHSNLYYFIPSITNLQLDQSELEISKIDYLIRCKCIKQYTDYFELGVWIRTMERWHGSNRLVMKDYMKIGTLICNLKILIDEMIGRHKTRLTAWSIHLSPSTRESK